MRAKQPKEKNEIEKKCENKNKTDKTNGEKTSCSSDDPYRRPSYLPVSAKLIYSSLGQRESASKRPKRHFNRAVFAGSCCFQHSNTQTHSIHRHMDETRNIVMRRNTQGEVTSQSLWSRYDRHFVGITRYNALS